MTETEATAADLPVRLQRPADLHFDVEQRVNAKDEAAAAADWLLGRRDRGGAWRDMVVVAPGKRNWRDPIAAALEQRSIPFHMLLGDPTRTVDRAEEHVHVMTLHAVAAHDFADMAILGIGDLPWKSQTLDEVSGLLQVAMTRATHALVVYHSKPSALAERLLSI